MAADDSKSIADQIDDDPSLVGVTAAEDRDDETDADSDNQTENPTWGDVWGFYADNVDWDFPRVLSRTQWMTALIGHPDVQVSKMGAAGEVFDRAVGGAIVETAPGSARYVVRGGHDDSV